MKSYVFGRIKYGDFGMGRILITKLLSRQNISMCKACLNFRVFIRIFNLQKNRTNINVPEVSPNQERRKHPVHIQET